MTSAPLALSATNYVAAPLVLGLIVGLGAIFVIVVVANRAGGDASPLRPYAVYAFGLAFAAIWSALYGVAVIASSLFVLIGASPVPRGNGVARGVLAGALFGLLGGALFLVHLRMGLTAAAGEDRDGPNARVARTYVAAVLFVAMALAVAAFGAAIWYAFAAASPAVFGGAGTAGNVHRLLDAIIVAALAASVLALHWRYLPDPLRPGRRRGDAGTGAIVDTGPVPPATPE
ncbi:MAG: hypothetical protein M0004_12900 [Actinomycetota bacterium]|nr:hypothetical protein [Actinomycetota bacterium]